MNEPTNQQAQDEVAAAEAALKAAQERLDAARKRAAADEPGEPDSTSEITVPMGTSKEV